MPFDPKAVEAAVERVLAATKKAAPDAEAIVGASAGRSANTRFARSEITSTGDVEELSIGLTVAFGNRHASVSTNQTDDASIEALAGRAIRLARLSPEDPEYVPVLGPQTYLPPAPGAFDDPTAGLATAARADAIVSALERAAKADVELAGFYSHSAFHSLTATSAGLRAPFSATDVDFSCTARTRDGTGSGWAAGTGHKVADLHPEALVDRAIDKAVRSKSPQSLPAGRYQVVLEPHAVSSLVGFLVGSLNARPAEEGRSFWSKPKGKTKLGERLFPRSVSIVADAFDPAIPAAPFDGQGLPRARTPLIDKGVVRYLGRSRYWAKKTGKPPTADPGPWQLVPGTASSEELVKGLDRGLLVTRFWYLRWLDNSTLTVTGLTRDGVFLVEKGQIVGPVNNFRFNQSPVALLSNVEALGRDLVRTGAARVPALRSSDFLMASVSEAV